MRRTQVLAVLAGLGLAGSAVLPALAEPVEIGTAETASLTACANWDFSIPDDPETEEDESEDHHYTVCADRFDDDGDGSDDRAALLVQQLGTDGFAQWGGDVDLADVTIDAEAGTASIDAVVPGISDATEGGDPCSVALTFAANGDAAPFSGEDLNAGVEQGESSLTISATRRFSGSNTPATATGSACGLARIDGVPSHGGSVSSYADSTDTVTVSA